MVAGLLHVKVNQGFVRLSGRIIQKPQHRPYLRKLAFHLVHQRRENRIDFIEIILKAMDSFSGAGTCSCNPQVEINMRIHGQQQMLQHDGPPALGGFKGNLPRSGRRDIFLILLKGLKIAIGKNYIQALHACAVLKRAFIDSGFHFKGNFTI